MTVRARHEPPDSTLVRTGDSRILREAWPLLAVLALLIGVAADLIVVALVAGTVLVTGYLSRLWAWLALTRVTVTQAIPVDHAFVGEEIEYVVRIRNRKILPLPWLQVRTDFPDIMPPAGRRLTPTGRPHVGWLERATSVRWYEAVVWRYRVPATGRGYFRIGPTRLRAGDLFGLFTHERDAPALVALWVYPRLSPLPEIAIPWQRPHGDRRGGPAFAEDITRLQGLRDTLPAVPLKRIDWKATARRGAMQTRVYEPSSTGQIVIALNVTTAAEVWLRGAGVHFERGVSAAATLAVRWLDRGVSVGLLANCTYPGINATIRVPASSAPAQRTALMEALAMADAFPVLPLERLLAEEARSLPAGASVVVVTAILTEALERALERLRRRGHPLAIVYVGEEDAPSRFAGAPVDDVGEAFDDVALAPQRASFVHRGAVRSDEGAAPPAEEREAGPAVDGARWARPPAARAGLESLDDGRERPDARGEGEA